MNTPPPLPPNRLQRRIRLAVFLLVLVGGIWWVTSSLLSPKPLPAPSNHSASKWKKPEFTGVVAHIDAAFRQEWASKGIEHVEKAPPLKIARRLSLGLTGSIPSLEEIRSIEKHDPDELVQWWISRLFEDQRYSDYLAERFARAYVGVEGGPFLIYRRRRMVNWLSEEIGKNQRYARIAGRIITGQGSWTSNPEVNFVTATIVPNMQKKGPDEAKLAARVTRAFLGVRLDCVQCHDDFLGDQWKQEDFHQLAAFFNAAEVKVNGVRDKKKPYKVRFRGDKEERLVEPAVPFAKELAPENPSRRYHLAQWVTHEENQAFARATVNRIWALMFGKPLVTPIDSIPLEGPYPLPMEILANDLAEHKFNLQRLVRIIAATEAFQLDSKADPHVTPDQEKAYAAFPLTRLRPEQVAGSVIQAASLSTIDADAHVLERVMRFFQQNEFVKRYGDPGESEFGERAGTIPQRLIMMNGNLVKERTKENPIMNASTRIAMLARSNERAIEAAYLCVLSRRPTTAELTHFEALLENKKGDQRNRAMEDVFWALLNSTEFSWNH